MRFAHISDCHLGGWRQPQLQHLNLESFRKAIDICIKEKLDFVLVSGDLFDSAYPPIEILKETFFELKNLKEAKIPCFVIAGSHDYSVSGKTFLDVLEKAGFCKNVANFEFREGKIILNPVIYGNVALYGYPGKKSGLEINELRNIKIQDSPGMFKIFMLHTTITKAKGTIPIDSIDEEELPFADYYALGHLHIDYQYENFVYPGPLFPNSFQELEDLRYGTFYIVDTTSEKKLKKIELKLKDVIVFEIEVKNALTATEKIIKEIDKEDIEDKIVLLRLKGELETGKNSDIKFSQIEQLLKRKGVYCYLKNTSDLKTRELELEVKIKDVENLEGEIIKKYSEENPSGFNIFVSQLMNSLEIEKQEGEKTATFEGRIIDEAKKILNF